MYKNFFCKQLFTIISVFLLTGTSQMLVAQTRSTNKIGGDRLAIADVSADKSSARIAAERNIYAAGENAVVNGQGYDQYEQVTVFVEQIDGAQKTDDVLASWTVVADEKGNINFNWQPSSSGSYRVKAVGAAKRETQTSFFVARSVAVVSGNIKCKDLNPNYQEFKIDPPRSGTYSLPGNNTVTAKFYGGGAGLKFVDFQSTASFGTVIVKGGNQGSNVYSYNPAQATDANLTTPTEQDISHVSFCYVPPFSTTAASAAVSGAVFGANGRALPRSMVTIQNLNTEETRTVVTNSFGRYRFNGLPVGDLYVVTITNKKAGFAGQSQSFVLNEDAENVNFAATAQ